VDFNRICFPLPENFATQKKVIIELHENLLGFYLKVLDQFNLKYSIQKYPEYFSADQKYTLIFGNLAVCPDSYYLGQPHIVAQEFKEELIE
jgi:hypothetical protein